MDLTINLSVTSAENNVIYREYMDVLKRSSQEIRAIRAVHSFLKQCDSKMSTGYSLTSKFDISAFENWLAMFTRISLSVVFSQASITSPR